MEHLKHAFYKIRYHVLRLPLVRSMVKWMFTFHININSSEIHAQCDDKDKTVCQKQDIVALIEETYVAQTEKEAVDIFFDLAHHKGKNICLSCVQTLFKPLI